MTGVDNRWTACLLCRSHCSSCPGVGADSNPDVTVRLVFSRHSIHIATPLHLPSLHTHTHTHTDTHINYHGSVCCCSQRNSLSFRILKDQFTSPCTRTTSPQTPSPCPWTSSPCPQALSPCPWTSSPWTTSP